MIEDRRWNEIAAVVGAAAQTLAAQQQLPFFLADVDVVQIGLLLRFVNGWAHVDSGLEPVPRSKLGGALYQELHKFVGDRFFNDDTAGCGAALASGGKRAEDRGLNREREIGVGENH